MRKMCPCDKAITFKIFLLLEFNRTLYATKYNYRQVSNIRRTLVDNYIVDYSDVVGASPVDPAPTTSSFST